MNRKNVWFVIVIYKPDTKVLRRLIAAVHEWSVEVVDNTQKNLGFGSAANIGMKKAFAAGARWVVVCNQDVVLTKTCIAKFVKALEPSEPGIIGPEPGSLDPKRWTTILPGRGSADYISGSMMAIHRKVWEHTEGFYEPYFMYYEDADLCVRASHAGFPLREVKIEGFLHVAKHADRSKDYYLARNHLLFVWRNAPMSVKLYELLRLPKTVLELWL